MKIKFENNMPLCGCGYCLHSKILYHHLRDDNQCAKCDYKIEPDYIPQTIVKYGIAFLKNNKEFAYKNFELHPDIDMKLLFKYQKFIKEEEFTI